MRRNLQSLENYTNQLCCLFVIRAPAAERYLSIGHMVKTGLSRGLSIRDIALSSGLSSDDCEFSLRYVEGPVWLKFESIAERWTWKQIKRAVARADIACEKQPVMAGTRLSGRSRQNVPRHQL